MSSDCQADNNVTGWRRRLHQFWTEQNEIQERLLLINRPWEEEFIRWAYDGHD